MSFSNPASKAASLPPSAASSALPSTYTAMILASPKVLLPQERRLTPLGPFEVWLRLRKAGICGTDIALYKGQYTMPLPLVLGHEFCGEVVEIGSHVDPSWRGQRVVGEINQSCLAFHKPTICPECKAGQPTHCEERLVTGILNADGAFSEYLRLPAANLHRLPASISDEEAVFVEPLAAAIQTFALRPLPPEACLVVLGAGRLGLLIIGVAKSLGAKVIAVTRSSLRQEAALRFGADTVLSPKDSLPSELRRLHHGRLPDAVVETTGQPDGLEQALSLVHPRGCVYLKTTCGLPSPLPLTTAVVHEIQFSASRCGPFEQAIDFLQTHPLPLFSWIAASYPLSEIETAILSAESPGKVLLSF